MGDRARATRTRGSRKGRHIVTDTATLDAMEQIDRALFVRGIFAERAYEDMPLPIACGQTISQPSVVGLMTQALAITARDKVLEVGTGSGYQAAILSKLARRVYTVDRYRRLVAMAREVFDTLNLSNITAFTADGSRGLADQAPFDRIIVTAAATREIPHALLDQLAPDGLMIAPMGDTARNQHLYRFSFDTDGNPEREKMWPVRFVPLIGGDEGKASG